MRILLGLTVFLLSATIAAAQGITVSPMQVEMVSSGAHNRAVVSVVNGSNQAMPVEAVVQRMALDENGKSHTAKAGDEFLVMPPQAMIPAGATQNFRIQWLGDPVIDQSQSFFIFFNQVPVKTPQGKAALQVVMSMGVMVNVAPPQGSPSLNLVSTGIIADKSGRRHPTITVSNPTKVHALLPQATVKLSSGSWSETLSAGLISERVGIGLVQPGRQRKFVLPVDLPPGVNSVQANLVMSPRRP
ncbi:MAG: molecular chaperone [Proteobacteria bacterium]|nr:molecular chaperone [Pseudomonadota bacterium]